MAITLIHQLIMAGNVAMEYRPLSRARIKDRKTGRKKLALLLLFALQISLLISLLQEQQRAARASVLSNTEDPECNCGECPRCQQQDDEYDFGR